MRVVVWLIVAIGVLLAWFLLSRGTVRRNTTERQAGPASVRSATASANDSQADDDQQDAKIMRVFERFDALGWESLSQEQQNAAAVWMLLGEVSNGGWAQFFDNSSGDYWRAALVGLEAIGATDMLDMLRKMVAAFGPDGPSDHLDERNRQVMQLTPATEALIEQLDRAFLSIDDEVLRRLRRYVALDARNFPPSP